VDGKWTHQNKLFDMPISLVSGISMNENDDHRRTYTNTGGIAVFDSTSSQNYAMSAKNFDQYLQADLRITERLVFNTGIRNSQTTLSSNTNNTLTTSVGSNAYRAMTHMASLQYYLTEITNVHLSYGSSFDTPTLNQVLYNSDGTGSSCTTVCY